MSEVNFRRAQFALTEGDFVVEYVEPLSPESVADIEQYLALLIESIKRRSKEHSHDEG